jgi:uncharacterized protein (DUF2062 family)
MFQRTRDKITQSAWSLLKAGMSYRKVALTIALGMVFGIFPIVGTSTVLCAVAALALRLNLPIIQIVNYAVYPLQIILLAPFLAAGAWLFGDPRAVDFDGAFIASMQNDPWGSLASLWDMILYAVAVWMVVSPIIVMIIYTILKPVMRKLASRPRLKSALTE